MSASMVGWVQLAFYDGKQHHQPTLMGIESTKGGIEIFTSSSSRFVSVDEAQCDCVGVNGLADGAGECVSMDAEEFTDID